MSSSRGINEVVRSLKKDGWEYVSRNKHIKFRSPSGRSTLTFSSSPSCMHAFRHILKDAEKLLKKEKEDGKKS